MKPATRSRIKQEGRAARHDDLKVSDCPYDGEKRDVWIQGWSEIDD